jgi:hypothetical protein
MENDAQAAQGPTYQDTLRAIGRYFDEQVYRNVLVCEVVDGYIARGFPVATTEMAKAEGLQFMFEDIVALIKRAREAHLPIPDHVQMPPLCPTGYEDFFRALGWECDAARVRVISIVEMKEGILVNYYRPERRSPTGGQWHQMFYDLDGITALLNKGFARRGQTQALGEHGLTT